MAKRQTRKKIDTAKLSKEIQRKAYQIYSERDEQAGDHLSDWYRAEREIKKKYRIR